MNRGGIGSVMDRYDLTIENKEHADWISYSALICVPSSFLLHRNKIDSIYTGTCPGCNILLLRHYIDHQKRPIIILSADRFEVSDELPHYTTDAFRFGSFQCSEIALVEDTIRVFMGDGAVGRTMSADTFEFYTEKSSDIQISFGSHVLSYGFRFNESRSRSCRIVWTDNIPVFVISDCATL